MVNKAEVTSATVEAVLGLWLQEFVVDVPAQHVGGQYLIDVVDLESYVAAIPAETTEFIANSVNSLTSAA